MKNIDIFAAVGKASAYDEYIEFQIKDNKVYHNGSEAAGAYDEAKKALKIRFIKGPRDNPKVNAIVILKGEIKGKLIKAIL